MKTLAAEEIIERLGLAPHPEGGYFRETYRHIDEAGGRGAGTAIYFLLREGERSHWHRVDAAEIWHFYAGAPLLLSTSSSPGKIVERTLGLDMLLGQSPQLIVDPNEWQSARTLGEYTLVGCTVSPAFLFEKFELADVGFKP